MVPTTFDAAGRTGVSHDSPDYPIRKYLAGASITHGNIAQVLERALLPSTRGKSLPASEVCVNGQDCQVLDGAVVVAVARQVEEAGGSVVGDAAFVVEL
jgi:hypothetical protein